MASGRLDLHKYRRFSTRVHPGRIEPIPSLVPFKLEGKFLDGIEEVEKEMLQGFVDAGSV